MTKKTIRSADRHLNRIDIVEAEKIRDLKSQGGHADEFSIRAFAVLARAVREIHEATNTEARPATDTRLDALIRQLNRLIAIKDRAEELREDVRHGRILRTEQGWGE